MAITSGFFNSSSGDRIYSAEDFGDMFDGIVSDGIFQNYGDAFTVLADNGDLTVDLGTGRAWFNGRWIYNDASVLLTISTPSLTDDRIDTIAIKVDKSAAGRACTVEVVAGTPATIPDPPVLTETSEIFWYPLYDVYVYAAGTQILPEDLTDRRAADTGWAANGLAAYPSYAPFTEAVGVNLIKGYPCPMRGLMSPPLWFVQYGASTLTEVGAIAEGLGAGTPHERLLKSVNSAANTGWQQTILVNSVAEKFITSSSSKVSGRIWVYADAGTTTFRLRDSFGTNLGAVSTSTTGSWVELKIENVTLLTGSLLVQMYNSSATATVYTAKPQVNVGSFVLPWSERGLVYKVARSLLYGPADPGGSAAGWQTLDLTSTAGDNCAIAELRVHYSNQTSSGMYVRTRVYGDTSSAADTIVWNTDLNAWYHTGMKNQIVDGQNRLEFYTNANAGDNEALMIYLTGYWEWE